MDKDWIVGSRKQIRGAVKQVVGKAIGDSKLESASSGSSLSHAIRLSHTRAGRSM